METSTFEDIRMNLKEKCQDLRFLQITDARDLFFSAEEMQLSYSRTLLRSDYDLGMGSPGSCGHDLGVDHPGYCG